MKIALKFSNKPHLTKLTRINSGLCVYPNPQDCIIWQKEVDPKTDSSGTPVFVIYFWRLTIKSNFQSTLLKKGSNDVHNGAPNTISVPNFVKYFLGSFTIGGGGGGIKRWQKLTKNWEGVVELVKVAANFRIGNQFSKIRSEYCVNL